MVWLTPTNLPWPCSSANSQSWPGTVGPACERAVKYPALPLASAAVHWSSGVVVTSLSIPDTGESVMLASVTRAEFANGIGHQSRNTSDPSGCGAAANIIDRTVLA